MRRSLLVPLLVCCLGGLGCGDDYVHVIVESHDPAVGIDTVQVAVFGAGRLTSFNYTGDFQSGDSGATSDFVITFPEVIDDEVDLRIGLPYTSRPAAGDARLTLPADGRELRIALTSADKAVDFLRHEVDQVPKVGLVASLGPGVALAWPSAAGVSLGIARNPNSPLPFPQVISSDQTAAGVHIASRPPAEPSDLPDIAAISWHSGDGQSYLVLYRDGGELGEVIAIGPGRGSVAVAPHGMDFEVATALVDQGTLTIRTHDGTGAILNQTAVPTGDVVELIDLWIDPDEAIIVGYLGAEGSMLTRLGGDGSTVHEPLPEEIRAVSGNVASGQVRVAALADGADGAQLHLRDFDSETLAEVDSKVLDALPIDAGIAVGSCAIAWTESRDDGSGDFDLRYQLVDASGRPSGPSHVLNSSITGDFLFPALACLSDGRAFASFFAEADSTVRLRCVPSADGQLCL